MKNYLQEIMNMNRMLTVTQKFLLADFVNESRGVVVSLVGKPCFESAIIVVTTLFYIHLVPLESYQSIDQITRNLHIDELLSTCLRSE